MDAIAEIDKATVWATIIEFGSEIDPWFNAKEDKRLLEGLKNTRLQSNEFTEVRMLCRAWVEYFCPVLLGLFGMPRGTAKGGAKTRSKAAAGKAQAKSTKPRDKGSALQEATKVASEAIGSSGDAAASKRASKRHNNRSNPRFAERKFDSGSEDEDEFRSTHDAPVGSVGGHTPIVSEYDDDSVHSLASDHGYHSFRTYVRSGSPAFNAKGSSKAGDNDEEKLLKHISLAEGFARAKATTAEDTNPSKKCTALKSPLREKKETGYSYRNLFSSSDEKEEEEEAAQRMRGGPMVAPFNQGAAINSRGYCPPEESSGTDLFLKILVAPRGHVGGPSSKGVYERALVQKEQLFADNLEAVQCVLLAPHRIPLKDFTTYRKKPENRGRIYLFWGYPWVLPKNCPKWNPCEDMFRLLSRFLNQRDLCARFAHLVNKRMDILKRAASSAHDERGYGVSSTSVPHSGKKPRTTYEGTPLLFPDCDSFGGPLLFGQAETEVPSYEYEYSAPPKRYARPSASPAGPTQGPEVDRLRQRVLVLEIALGLGTGGDAAAQAGNQGELARLAGRLDLFWAGGLEPASAGGPAGLFVRS
ncbi:hypothetical protein PInf_007157 [Phytophthora infestans]|nr:hypothetical protein PInf_007157 [Phytophthora infestans]